MWKTLNSGQKLPYLALYFKAWILKDQKTIARTLKFSKQIFIQKQKNIKFGTKMLLGYLQAWILKNYCHIWCQHFRISNTLCKTNNFQTGIQKCLICVILGCRFKILLPYLKSAASNLSKCKVLWEKKILKFGAKNSFLSIFRLKFEKANVIFEKIPKIEQNNNKENSNNKKWNQKCLIWVLWPIILKNCCIFEINLLEFAEMQKTIQDKKNQIWDQKCLIWAFWDVSLKSYWYIWNQLPRICQNTKFRAKIKILKGTLTQIWQFANIFVIIWK